jgi:hypothetical protein
MIELSVDEAARRLTELRDQLNEGDSTQTAKVVEDGQPVLAVIPWHLYEALVTTAQIPVDARALLAAPADVRHATLAAAAARAELLYGERSDLTDFEAFGPDDLHDDAE